eukprot:5485018-Prymnesium_polylepis.2
MCVCTGALAADFDAVADDGVLHDASWEPLGFPRVVMPSYGTGRITARLLRLDEGVDRVGKHVREDVGRGNAVVLQLKLCLLLGHELLVDLLEEVAVRGAKALHDLVTFTSVVLLVGVVGEEPLGKRDLNVDASADTVQDAL